MDATVARGAYAHTASVSAVITAAQSFAVGALKVLVTLADAVHTLTMVIAIDTLTGGASPRQVAFAHTVHARTVVVAVRAWLTGNTFAMPASKALLAHAVTLAIISTVVRTPQHAAVFALVFGLAGAHAISTGAVVAAIVQAGLLSAALATISSIAAALASLAACAVPIAVARATHLAAVRASPARLAGTCAVAARPVVGTVIEAGLRGTVITRETLGADALALDADTVVAAVLGTVRDSTVGALPSLGAQAGAVGACAMLGTVIRAALSVAVVTLPAIVTKATRLAINHQTSTMATALEHTAFLALETAEAFANALHAFAVAVAILGARFVRTGCSAPSVQAHAGGIDALTVATAVIRAGALGAIHATVPGGARALLGSAVALAMAAAVVGAGS